MPAILELFPEHHGSPPDKMFPVEICPAMRRNRSSSDGKPSKDGHLPPNPRTPWELLLFSCHSLFITNHVLSSMT